MTTKKCIQCGRKFERPYGISQTLWKKRKFCSRSCVHNYYTQIIICEMCGKKFARCKSYSKGKVKFCSQICSNNPSRRKDMGGKIKTICKFCGNEFLAKRHRIKKGGGIYCSPKCRDKDGSGKNHWNWKGGKTSENQKIRRSRKYKVWRLAVYARDHYTCQDCDTHCTSKTIVAHHLKSFNDYIELRFEVDNGITLCRKCHKKRHKEIGLKTRF